MKLSLSIIILVILGSLSNVNARQEEGVYFNDDIMVYYFHATRRCATCEAVEAVARKTVKEYYGDEVKFIVINREEEKNKALVEKFKISGQTLLVVKDEKIENLTNLAFMNAMKKPEKVKDAIISAVDSMK
jgi:hypothetical protein